eukprot:7721649-Prorocentrum_lima.AAC.1
MLYVITAVNAHGKLDGADAMSSFVFFLLAMGTLDLPYCMFDCDIHKPLQQRQIQRVKRTPTSKSLR